MKTKKEVIDENIRVHKEESEIYDSFHIEIYNWYESKKTEKDIEFIKKMFSRKSKIDFLDVGCGTGHISGYFINDFNYNITGIDLSKQMIDCFKHKFSRIRDVNLINSSIEDFLVKNNKKYDLVTISSVIHHLHDPYSSFEQLLDIINEDGVIYLTHEPLVANQQRQNLISKVINIIDKILSNFYWIYKFKRVPKIDYSVSDYHNGIDLELLTKLLNKNFNIIYIEKYSVNRIGALSFLSNLFGLSNNFKIIAQKNRI